MDCSLPYHGQLILLEVYYMSLLKMKDKHDETNLGAGVYQ